MRCFDSVINRNSFSLHANTPTGHIGSMGDFTWFLEQVSRKKYQMIWGSMNDEGDLEADEIPRQRAEEVEAVDIADAEAIPTIPLERRFPEMPSWKCFLSWTLRGRVQLW